ncbi:MAG: sigma-70 family RNA polymerase sigma factor [Gemmataceae bacterium]
MATGPLAPVVHYLRKVTNPTVAGDIADAELLSRFALHRDEAAFTSLVRRHGRMVLAVCRRVVRDGHAAEDAFQATFLVLARKAGSLARPELLGNWLHGVAYRTAMKAKIETAKRRVHETRAVRPQEVDSRDETEWHDLRTVLDEEVNRLPERYRVPVVLCYLQGQTNAEAARRLGCSRGTVATLLARARDKLRRRLTQRGVGLTAGVALAALTRTEGGAAPLALEHVTVKAAMLLAAGQTQAVGALAAQAVALAKGVSKGMLIEKLKIPTVILMMTALVGVGAGVGAYRASAQDSDVAESPKEAKPRPQNKTARPPVPISAPIALPRDEIPEGAKATYRTPNFIVTAPTKEIARQVGQAAEHERKALAKLWLDEELADWAAPCPVHVTITDEPNSSSQFAFHDGEVSRGGMILEGRLDRIFADLLPHEMTHTILAQWRGQPLPRWADEGAATLSESNISRERYEQLLVRLLRIGRPLPLSELLPKLDYPKDVGIFYAQSFSLTNFLMTAGGRKKFLAFVAQGQDEGWDKAAQTVYHEPSIKTLEKNWLSFEQMRLAGKRSDEPAHPRQESKAARKNEPDFTEKLPGGLAPLPAFAGLSEDERLVVVFRNALYYEPVTTYVRSKDGQTLPVTTYQEKRSFRAVSLNLVGIRVHDAKGRNVDDKELRKRLTKGEVVLVSADGNPVDPLHLRLYKEDTLVFVLQLKVPPMGNREAPIPAPTPNFVQPLPVAPPPVILPLPPSETMPRPQYVVPTPAVPAAPITAPPPPRPAVP